MTALWALFLLLLGLLLWIGARRQQRAQGLPDGVIIYDDAGDWQRNQRTLFSQRYRLSGKPDYLVRSGREIIPVELKTTRLRGRPPYHSHQMQLAAYCLLVEETMGMRPSYGILKYDDVTLRVPYDEPLRQELLDTLRAMRRAMSAGDVARSHQERQRCRHCGYRHVCDQALP